MPTLDRLNEEELKEGAKSRRKMVKHFDNNNYCQYAKYVQINNYKPACDGDGGKCFLVDKQTHRLALISKGACLVDYHEKNAASKYDLHQQMFITPLLYGRDQHLNASLVPDNPDGTQKVWISLQWRNHEDPTHPGKWDGDERKCDRYVLGEFVVVQKVKKDKFECILLLPANHSYMDTFDLLEKYATRVVQSDTYIKNFGLQMNAMKKSRDFNRERAQRLLQAKEEEHNEAEKNMKMLQAEIEKKASLIKKKEVLVKKRSDEKGQDSSEIEGLMQEINDLSNELNILKAKFNTSNDNENRLMGEIDGLRKELNQEKAAHANTTAHHEATTDRMNRLDCQVKYNLPAIPTSQEYYRLTNPSSGKAPMVPVKRGGPSSGKAPSAKCSRR